MLSSSEQLTLAGIFSKKSQQIKSTISSFDWRNTPMHLLYVPYYCPNDYEVIRFEDTILYYLYRYRYMNECSDLDQGLH